MSLYNSKSMRDRLKSGFEKNKSNEGHTKDSRIWSEDFKNSDTYQIRFTCDNEFNTVVKYKEHTVKYIDSRGMEKSEYFICPKINEGQECPVCDKMKKLWEDEKNGVMSKEQVKEYINANFPTKTRTITNVKVVKDEKRPENVGKVFLFRVNGYIDEHIQKQMRDKSEVDDPEFVECIPFDPIKAPIFYLQYIAPTGKGSYPKWSGSKFLKTLSTIKGEKVTEETTDEELGKLEKGCMDFVNKHTHNLNSYLDEIKKKAPTYDEISAKIGQYIYGTNSSNPILNSNKYVDKKDLVSDGEDEDDDIIEDIEKDEVVVVKSPAPKKEIKNIKQEEENIVNQDDIGDDDVIDNDDDIDGMPF